MTITTTGLKMVQELLSGNSTGRDYLKYLAIGSGTANPLVTQSGLGSEYKRYSNFAIEEFPAVGFAFRNKTQFDTGTLTTINATGNNLKISTGSPSGTWRSVEMVTTQPWQTFRWEQVVPTGATVDARIISGGAIAQSGLISPVDVSGYNFSPLNVEFFMTSGNTGSSPEVDEVIFRSISRHSMRFSRTWLPFEDSNNTFNEFGLFAQATGGSMFNRAAHSGVALAEGSEYKLEFTVNVL